MCKYRCYGAYDPTLREKAGRTVATCMGKSSTGTLLISGQTYLVNHQ
ncbi:hypothetical protein [uncultured Fibrella sp.]